MYTTDIYMCQGWRQDAGGRRPRHHASFLGGRRRPARRSGSRAGNRVGRRDDATLKPLRRSRSSSTSSDSRSNNSKRTLESVRFRCPSAFESPSAGGMTAGRFARNRGRALIGCSRVCRSPGQARAPSGAFPRSQAGRRRPRSGRPPAAPERSTAWRPRRSRRRGW